LALIPPHAVLVKALKMCDYFNEITAIKMFYLFYLNSFFLLLLKNIKEQKANKEPLFMEFLSSLLSQGQKNQYTFLGFTRESNHTEKKTQFDIRMVYLLGIIFTIK